MKPSRKELFQKRIRVYQKDPVLFAKEVCHFIPDDWQAKVMMDIAASPRVSVRSGHGVGKTGMEAVIALWFLCCFKFPKVVCTAPTRQQLNDVLWSEIDKWRTRSKILCELLSWTKTYIYMNGYGKRWFAVAKTASKPENMQGFHEENMLFIIDEASGIEEEIMEAILATLSGGNNKLLMCANPTRTTGTFYDSHHINRDLYKCHRVSSLDSSRTNKENIQAFIRKYGEDSNVVKVRVYGDFPTQEDDTFIPLSLVEQAIVTEIEGDTNEITIGVDVARFGDDETIIATDVGGKIELPVIRHGQSLMRTVGDIVQTYKRLIAENKSYKGVITCNIDDTGLGGGVTDRLQEVKTEEKLTRLEINAVNFGSKPPENDNYDDITSFMWAGIKERLEERSIQLCNDEELVAQLSVRKYSINSKGYITLEPKKKMKERGIKSPDRGDAVALALFRQKKIYNAFIEQSEAVIIPWDSVRGMGIMQINVGISIGGSINGTSIVATAIMQNHKKAIVLASTRYVGEVETSALGEAFYSFCTDIQKKYGRTDYVYVDANERFLYKCIRETTEAKRMQIQVRQSANDDEMNRIRLTTRLMAQARLFLTNECDSLARAFNSATWTEKTVNDSRSKSSDIATLNAFEYTLEREAARFLNNE